MVALSGGLTCCKYALKEEILSFSSLFGPGESLARTIAQMSGIGIVLIVF